MNLSTFDYKNYLKWRIKRFYMNEELNCEVKV